jgi:hypothetical protein
MLKKGDIVTHNTLPPVEGVVYGIENRVNGQPMIAVMKLDGNLFYDTENHWNVKASNYLNQQRDDIIDVDYVEIE